MQASSALQPSVRWSFQVFSNLSLEQPLQTCHHTHQDSAAVKSLKKYDRMNASSQQTYFPQLTWRSGCWHGMHETFLRWIPFPFFLHLPGKSSPEVAQGKNLHPQSLCSWMASLTSTLDLGEVRGDRGDRGDLAGSVLASFSSFLATQKKPSWWFGRNKLRYHKHWR